MSISLQVQHGQKQSSKADKPEELGIVVPSPILSFVSFVQLSDNFERSVGLLVRVRIRNCFMIILQHSLVSNYGFEQECCGSDLAQSVAVGIVPWECLRRP
jgi:hypothetical protein